ncbi:hypothetical protein B0J11DRAFT_525696 [Dendryphion nanum]|uniref:Uncharacterized protein n=1 Tax=Dendryphion nanum TaxID=256645 RepID=A0A9P9IQF7_9PLEO|nr:hypothetical protein B0J11DRAFT_525696 [Dendryphion nanum]
MCLMWSHCRPCLQLRGRGCRNGQMTTLRSLPTARIAIVQNAHQKKFRAGRLRCPERQCSLSGSSMQVNMCSVSCVLFLVTFCWLTQCNHSLSLSLSHPLAAMKLGSMESISPMTCPHAFRQASATDCTSHCRLCALPILYNWESVVPTPNFS